MIYVILNYSGPMRTINKKRAELIYNEYKSNDCGIEVKKQINTFLKNTPSYVETGVCQRKGCSSAKNETIFPLISLNHQTFGHKFDNLVAAIDANLPDSSKCSRCRHDLTNFERTFSDGIFIEVISSIQIIIKNFKFCFV